MSDTSNQLFQLFQEYYQKEYDILSPRELYEPIDYLMGIGGKRFRPILLLKTITTLREIEDADLKFALGIELFHNFTLMHDDIMDNADIRRGKASVHTKYNLNTAILSGDVMLIQALQYIHASSDDHLLAEFLKIAQWICDGQQLDMNFENTQNISEEEYIEMVKLKTAVLLAYAVYAGCMKAGYSPAFAKKAYQFVEEAGIAFQIWDDYLDAFGNEKTGKKTGGDIENKKETFLMIHLKNRLSESDQHNFQNIMKKDTIHNADIQNIISLLKKYDIHNYTREFVTQKMNHSIDELKKFEEYNLFRPVADFCIQFIQRDS